MAEETEKLQYKDKPITKNLNGNGLVLYSFHHCFDSQKVMMALYEKKLPFTNEIVDVTKHEQYKSWFLKINPTGTLPVLKDGIKYIPDSNVIIQYLEDNFSNGEYARLIPIDQGLDVKLKVISYYEKISKISPYVVTMGTIINNRWCSNLRYPYSLSYVRRSLKASLLSSSKYIKKYASKNPEFESTLLQIADLEDKKIQEVNDAENYNKVIQSIEDLLGEIERDFYERGDDQSHWWLCCDTFTIADIALTVLLDRLSRLGMELNFWTGGMRPHVEIYYRRVQQRESYKNIIPTPKNDINFILNTRGHIIIGVSIIAAISVALGSYFLFRK